MSLHPPRRLSGDEALYLYLETPRSPMNVGLIAEVDGVIDGDLLSAALQTAAEHIPALRCRLQPAPVGLLHPRFIAEDPFLVEQHFRQHELADASEIDAQAAAILAPHLDRGAPLWELHLLQLSEEGRSVLVFKAHRAIVHEPSGMTLFSQLVRQMNHDRDAAATSPEPIFHEIGQPVGPDDVLQAEVKEDSLPRELLRGGLEQLLGSFDWLRLASESNRLALRTLNDIVPDLALPVKRLPFNRLGSGEREVARLTLSYAEARGIRQALGGSIGDVSLTVVTTALARLLSGNRTAESRHLRLLCPLSTQFLLEDSTVATTYLPLALQLNPGEISNLYRAVRTQTRTLRAARVPQAIREALEIITDWPAPTVAQLARAARFVLPCNALFTQVAGPQVPLRVQDRKLKQIHPIHSLLREHGIGFSSLSYNQRICIGVTSDQLAFAQLPSLCENIESAMHELKRAADVRDMHPIEVGRPAAPAPQQPKPPRRRSKKRSA